MVLIQDIAQQALNTGYLSIADQNQIQVLLKTNFDSEDVDALIILQRAIASGRVKQESLNYKSYTTNNSRDKKSNIKLAYQIAAEMTFAAAVALTMPKNSPDQPSLGT
ncbi:hypothetical protein ACN23B_06355 [Anabaena sp. FACHB-709]|uniref:Uncharacterized protein n=2 Tax=Nostocaceae TaxID=1162 RepID=A0A1Z4KTJ6_ANAVA|nr:MULTISPECIES: hypothetical protein [Nostocaceae]BAY72248.1 hypothetical protein NIES23_50720 [Trichormus variabilis NIES-23]HBW29174.1 hypothetical protein [Nostoc sp. UBA8866]MBD2170641.1 hypothetical protein [Anabaena cylindrica FACHB-318]MBD2262428.1 hypothetical protein [Anabaena sp. FACHB-709]MBD2271975.1 hypothetical protein [Nostoc sp. PCC 7120 = FACHB-418]